MLIFDWRKPVIAAVLLLMPLGAMADRIVMKNGDVITGNISLVNDDEVLIEPGYADEFAVDTAEIATVEIDDEFEVELADGTKTGGRITLDADGRQILLTDGSAMPLSLADIAAASEPDAYFEWGAKVDLSSTINSGNTDSRNTILYSEGNVRHGDHRHYGNLTFRREETNNDSTKEQDLFNYAYNWMFNEPWYMGGTFSFERDPIRELDHRYTFGLIAGRDLFDDANRFLTFSFGVGFSDEKIGGISESGAVGLWHLRYEQTLWGGVDFFHNQNFTWQFYGVDNAIYKTNTGFRVDLLDDLYASVSLRYDYESEPAESASKDDSTLQLGLGYSF